MTVSQMAFELMSLDKMIVYQIAGHRMIVDKMLRDVARKVFLCIFCWTEGEGGKLGLYYKTFYVRN